MESILLSLIGILVFLLCIGGLIVLDIHILSDYFRSKNIALTWWRIGLVVIASCVVLGFVSGVPKLWKFLLFVIGSIILLLPPMRLVALQQKAKEYYENHSLYISILELYSVITVLLLALLWLTIPFTFYFN